MAGEKPNLDLKVDYDINNPKAKVELIKDLVALANAGGGTIVFGRTETEAPGIDSSTQEQLDSARVSDFADRFTAPHSLQLSHTVEGLENGNIIFTLEVEKSESPIAMSRIGTWSGFDGSQDNPLFLPGDIWTRHSTKTEKANSEDLRRWIESAKQSEREKIMERLTTYVNLPEGTILQAVSPSGLPIDSPMRLIESAQYRRERDPDHLLSGEDLVWIFRQRESLDLEETGTDMLIASSLRRSATLFWWVAESDKETIINQLLATFEASDRDKSDAASSIIELAALYASDDELDRILDLLDNSRYAHFREAAQSWQDRDTELQETRNRIVSSTHKSTYLAEMSISDLESLASAIAEDLSEQPSAALSRKLGTITRVIWSKKSDRGNELLA